MKKITQSTFIVTLLFSLVSLQSLFAQTALKEISLKQQIDKSSLVVEGKVIERKSFWDVNHKNIYTSNKVEVYKVFKGKPISIIEVITPGGTIGLQAEVVTPSLQLREGDIGVFSLHNSYVNNGTAKSTVDQFMAYSSVQGFYKYNLNSDLAVNSFNKKEGIASTFYNEIMSHTKSKFTEVSKFDVVSKQSKSSQSKNFLPPNSITFSPMTLSAGTASVLTISGAGFGATQGKVGFSDADDGGATFIDALDTQVLTWSDTEITVEVPSNAGTGNIRITDGATPTPTIGVSAADLTITYSESNATSDAINSGVFVAYPVQHINNNSSGGYTWTKTSHFEGVAGAEAAFTRALDTWRCETKVNWVIDATAIADGTPPTGAEQHQAVNDNINIIAFDDNTSIDPLDDLPDNVLGRCTSYYSGCIVGGTSVQWYVSELDIVFDDEISWNYGTGLPAFSEYDFESVSLHELGHGHQLAHVIDGIEDGTNLDDVMHFAISNGEAQRTLRANNIAAGNDVHSRSTTGTPCSESVMIDSTICTFSVEEDELNNAISIFPNPAANQFFIKNTSFINLEKVVIYDLSGRLINEYDISNTSRTKTIDVLGVSKGIYFVNIFSDNASITKKLIIE